VIIMADKKVGVITNYFNHLGVGIVKLSAPLARGDQIKIVGRGHEFAQAAESMQLDHTDIEDAGKGKEIGLKVNEKVKKGDEVFKVTT